MPSTQSNELQNKHQTCISIRLPCHQYKIILSVQIPLSHGRGLDRRPMRSRRCRYTIRGIRRGSDGRASERGRHFFASLVDAEMDPARRHDDRPRPPPAPAHKISHTRRESERASVVVLLRWETEAAFSDERGLRRQA